MSIEKLEKAKEHFLDADKFKNTEAIDWFMFFTIELFKDQLNQIADLRQELAKKEDAIDMDNIKIGGTD